MTYPFRRGDVYLLQFPLPDQPGKTITKYAVNLQEGKIIEVPDDGLCHDYYLQECRPGQAVPN